LTISLRLTSNTFSFPYTTLFRSLSGRFEGRRTGKFGVHLPATGEPAELLPRPFGCCSLVLAPGHRDLPELPGMDAGRFVPLPDQLRIRVHRDHRVGQSGEPLDGLVAGNREIGRASCREREARGARE